jgi:CCR4-NOT transcription complex subunit 1
MYQNIPSADKTRHRLYLLDSPCPPSPPDYLGQLDVRQLGIDKVDGDVFRDVHLMLFVDQVGLRPLEGLVLAASIVGVPTRRELFTQATAIIWVEFDNAVHAHTSFEHANLPCARCKAHDDRRTHPSSKPRSCTHQVWPKDCRAHAPAHTPFSQVGLRLSLSPLPSLTCTCSCATSPAFVLCTLNQLGPEITSDSDAVQALFVRFNIMDSNHMTHHDLAWRCGQCDCTLLFFSR